MSKEDAGTAGCCTPMVVVWVVVVVDVKVEVVEVLVVVVDVIVDPVPVVAVVVLTVMVVLVGANPAIKETSNVCNEINNVRHLSTRRLSDAQQYHGVNNEMLVTNENIIPALSIRFDKCALGA